MIVLSSLSHQTRSKEGTPSFIKRWSTKMHWSCLGWLHIIMLTSTEAMIRCSWKWSVLDIWKIMKEPLKKFQGSSFRRATTLLKPIQKAWIAPLSSHFPHQDRQQALQTFGSDSRISILNVTTWEENYWWQKVTGKGHSSTSTMPNWSKRVWLRSLWDGLNAITVWTWRRRWARNLKAWRSPKA